VGFLYWRGWMPTIARMSFYREDLAYIHDSGFGHSAQHAAPLLVNDLRQRGLDRGLVIDFGCGSGILSEHVAAAGYDVLGIDLSPEFIAMAQRRVPVGSFRVGSVLKEELPKCVGVAAIGEIVNYLFDADHSLEQLAQLFRRILTALVPGGTLLFDASEPGRVPGPGPLHFNRQGDDWAIMGTADEDRQTRLLTRRMVSFRKTGELYRRDGETHLLRLLPRADLAEVLRGIGFEVQFLDGYGVQLLPAGMVAILAHKPH
jgi:SAM-dependent methyltransferase